MADLYQTYDNCQDAIADSIQTNNPLLPVAHLSAKAVIEVVVNMNGDFKSASVLNKEEAYTIIPVTEDSASRSGKANYPHMLEDKLEYIAGDYVDNLPKSEKAGPQKEEKTKKAKRIKKDKKDKKDIMTKYKKYMGQLGAWVQSEYSCSEIKAIYKYLSKACLISDLSSLGILKQKNGLLTDIKINGIEQSKALVRFSVMNNVGEVRPVYQNISIFNLYSRYYENTQKDNNFCYVTGKQIPCVNKHPAKIRNSGDKSKLISSNDEEGFTYLGRFTKSDQVATIGYTVSQKAHSALRWLIGRQGFSIDEMTVVAWVFPGKKEISIAKDTEETFGDEDAIPDNDTGVWYAQKLKLAVNSYKAELNTKAQIVVMGLEAATQGRLSIRFYTKMAGSQFLENVQYWHGTCFWRHFYKGHLFVGVPALYDIAAAAYGEKNEKVLKDAIERLIPCVIRKNKLPRDIMIAAVYRSLQPYSFHGVTYKARKNNWQKNISITCALIRKYRYDDSKEEFDMSLNENCQDRSYVFGRLLGAAQKLEEVAIYYSGENPRTTAAERFFMQFKQHPVKTLGIIETNLRPYVAKLKVLRHTYYENELRKIYELLTVEDMQNDRSLSELFLLGYSNQINFESKTDKTKGERK